MAKSTRNWVRIAIRGMELAQEPSGARRLWGVGSRGIAVASRDPSRNFEVLGTDSSDPFSNQTADLKGVFAQGNYVYLIASVGGNGVEGTRSCTNPRGTSYGCFRMQMFRSSVPLGVDTFHSRLLTPAPPMNPADYQRVVRAPDGSTKIIGEFFNPPKDFTYPFNTLHFEHQPQDLIIYTLDLSVLQFSETNSSP